MWQQFRQDAGGPGVSATSAGSLKYFFDVVFSLDFHAANLTRFGRVRRRTSRGNSKVNSDGYKISSADMLDFFEMSATDIFSNTRSGQ